MAANGRRKRPTDELIVEELRLLRRSIDSFSANTGKWLSAVATAAANPADNSSEVQQMLDSLAEQLSASSDAVEHDLNQTKQGEK